MIVAVIVADLMMIAVLRACWCNLSGALRARRAVVVFGGLLALNIGVLLCR